MTKPEENIANWLASAHDEEERVIEYFDEHVRLVADIDPALAQTLRRHAAARRSHAKRVDNGLVRLRGTTVAAGSAAAAAVRGAIKAVTASSEKDRESALYLEEYEATWGLIGRYMAIVAAARLTGDDETATEGDTILTEKRAIATWLEERIPQAAKEFIERGI